MNRTALVIAIAVVLFLAFMAGWVLRWLFGRMNSVNSVNVSEIDDLANRLHEAEEARPPSENRVMCTDATCADEIPPQVVIHLSICPLDVST